jgi:hypothetical protein
MNINCSGLQRWSRACKLARENQCNPEPPLVISCDFDIGAKQAYELATGVNLTITTD